MNRFLAISLSALIAGSAASQTITGGVGSGSTTFANPTGSVGLTSANGVSSAAERADATHAIDVTISPTWTGAHTFNGGFGGTGVSTYLASPPAIGGTAPNPGSFSTLTDTALTAGQPVCTNGSKVLSSTCGQNAAVFAKSTGSPPATSSTTLVMAGFATGSYGGAPLITPATTGRLLVTFTGNIWIATAANPLNMAIYYGSGTAPVNGATSTGAQCGTTQTMKTATTGSPNPSMYSATCVITGLTIGTTYWLDAAFDTSNAADAVQISAYNVSAVEF